MSEEAATLDEVGEALAEVRGEVAKRIVGQREAVDHVLACLLANGNALLESNPGLAKTLMVRTIAEVTDLDFSRIQNTPDLMPSDITGTEIIREADGSREFVFERGPVFANIVLADEINRATPKTQAALLEAMEEKQVTAAGETYELPRPFFLLATQNPIDLEGSLHPDETLLMNGRLWTAREALAHARAEGELVHDGDTRVYEFDGSTLSLDDEGSLDTAPAMVYETDYEGRLFTVETKTGRSTRVSGNHPSLVNRAGVIRWVEARDLDDGDHLVTPKRLPLEGTPFPSHGEALDRLEATHGHTVVRRDELASILGRLERDDPLPADEVDALRIAAGLSKKDLARRADVSYDRVLNFLAGTRNGIEPRLRAALAGHEIVPGDYAESHRTHRIDDGLSPADAGFFVGFALAEGHVTRTGITVSRKNQPDVLDRWVDLAEGIGLDVAVTDDPTGRRVRISSKPFVDYLRERYHLDEPERYLSAPEAFREAFVETFLLAESHFDAERRRITFVHRDRTLTNVLAYLLLGFDVVPWVYDRDARYELRIQGVDLSRYLERFSWRGEPPDVDGLDVVHRPTPLREEQVGRPVGLLGLAYEGGRSDRPWHTSVRHLRTRRDGMAAGYLEGLPDDVEGMLARRRIVDVRDEATVDPGAAAKPCGLPMTAVDDGSVVAGNRVWDACSSDRPPEAAIDYVVEANTDRIAEAEALTDHRRGHLDGDVFYDRVTSVESAPYEGQVIGLSVPGTHNYVAGFGACGINHNTYELPEAQSDRFLMKVLIDYPSFEEEREIVDRYTKRLERYIPVERVLSRDELTKFQELTRQVPIADDLRDRAIQVVQATRDADTIEFGASPRASMALVVTAKARALLRGRAHVSAEDIEAMAPPVLRHRIVVDFRAEREGMTPDDVIRELL